MAKKANPTKISELTPDDKNFSTKELAEYVNFSRHYIYKLIVKRGLPNHKNSDGEIYFIQSEIDLWLIDNPKERGESYLSSCATCGSGIVLHNYRKGKARKNYCSRECRKTAKVINCSFCDNEITRVPAQIENYNFCNKVCMGKYQTKFRSGENSKHFLGDYKKYYGSDWNSQRNLARERDGYLCQLCGVGEVGKQHDVHHRKAFALFGIENHKEANDLSNLVTLCNSCHSSIEPKRKKDVKEKEPN